MVMPQRHLVGKSHKDRPGTYISAYAPIMGARPLTNIHQRAQKDFSKPHRNITRWNARNHTIKKKKMYAEQCPEIKTKNKYKQEEKIKKY